MVSSNQSVELTEASSDGVPPKVLVVMGVTGTGKSTLAKLLSSRLGWDLEEGDDLHPASNVAKMSRGQPLTDEDRWPWLEKIADWIRERVSSGTPGIVTCSALRRAYRDKLRAPGVTFVHLAATKELISARLSQRSDHFMPASLLDSQLATLEPLGSDERGVVVQLGRTPEQDVHDIITRLLLTPV